MNKIANKDQWMFGWVAKNCKFAQALNPSPKNIGLQPHKDKHADFMNKFKDWVQEPDVWPHYLEFIKTNVPHLIGGHMETDISPEMAWEFIREGDIPDWVQEYCEHEYGAEGCCTKCGHIQQHETAQDRIDYYGDKQYDEMVDRSL